MNGVTAAPWVRSVAHRAERVLRRHVEVAARTLKRKFVVQQHHQIRFIAARTSPLHTQYRSRSTAGRPDALLPVLWNSADT